jgi:hypothetical protein
MLVFSSTRIAGLVGAVVLSVGAWAAVSTAWPTLSLWMAYVTAAPDEVIYHGERIKVTTNDLEADDHEETPFTIHPSEIERVTRLMTEAPVARTVASAEGMIRAVSDLVFPGYGTSMWAAPLQADGSVFAGFTIEIPSAGKDRVLVFLGKNGHGGEFTLVDDFVYPAEALGINAVHQEGDAFVYSSWRGERVLVRRLAS